MPPCEKKGAFNTFLIMYKGETLYLTSFFFKCTELLAFIISPAIMSVDIYGFME